ncbi:hypothetical protein NDU88_003766 [Pleurodeles waltl]|uniref:Uncharacterized protein n=1 Tax=Pleurodeles waltl TaxID=8319 RepID=A0AAV7PDS5_PLEWA|nr:hypothetical protein NDU88_003766 [Pleurodeles waltl]
MAAYPSLSAKISLPVRCKYGARPQARHFRSAILSLLQQGLLEKFVLRKKHGSMSAKSLKSQSIAPAGYPQYNLPDCR